MKGTCLVWVIVLALCGCRGADRSGVAIGPPREASLNASLSVAADNPSALDGPTAQRLPLLRMRTLFVRVSLRALPANPTWLTFQMTAPNGMLFRQERYPFSVDPTMKTVVDGSGYAMPVRRAVSVTGGYQLDFGVPVGGTNLQVRPMPGNWKFSVDVEGGPHLEQLVDLRVKP